MRQIQLTKGKVTLVDDTDYDWLNQWMWSAMKSRRTKRADVYYAYRSQKDVNNKWKIIMMHRLILNAPEWLEVDHINGDGLYNLRSNLRVATGRQNTQNKHIPKSSVYPGVFWAKNMNKWGANICLNKRNICLGWFDIEGDAYSAYKKTVESLGQTVINL